MEEGKGRVRRVRALVVSAAATDLPPVAPAAAGRMPPCFAAVKLPCGSVFQARRQLPQGRLATL